MSNKLKGAARIYPYVKTKGELRHEALVREARKQGHKHPGSKRLHVLCQVVPSKFANAILNRVLSKVR